MKAKLFKTSNGIYDLFEGTRFISTTDSPDSTINKLSIKNCEAIERGYDLDELARDGVKFHEQDEIHRPNSEHLYKKGFQKAIELMGDKKFSEKDVLKSLHKLADSFIKGYPYHQDLDFQEGNQIIQSLQQTEWDVEIEMEDYLDDSLSHIKGEIPVFRKIQKLDSNGCLILKKI
jgi:hypothetical protein